MPNPKNRTREDAASTRPPFATAFRPDGKRGMLKWESVSALTLNRAKAGATLRATTTIFEPGWLYLGQWDDSGTVHMKAGRYRAIARRLVTSDGARLDLGPWIDPAGKE